MGKNVLLKKTLHLTVLIPVFILIFVFTAAASAGEGSIELKPHWKQGAKKKFEIIKNRKKVGEGKVLFDGTGRTDLEISVEKADSQGYLVNWTMGETKFDQADAAKNPIAKQAANLLKGFAILLEVSPSGELKGVKNWEELKSKATEALNAMAEVWRKSGFNEQMISQLNAQVSSTFATKEEITRMCTREPNLYFMTLGRTYKAGEPLTYDTLLPNPFGGEAFPATGSFVVARYDKESGKAEVEWNQKIQPEAAKRVLSATLKKLGGEQGKNIKEDLLPKNYKIEDSGKFVIDVPSGWVLSLTQSRTVMTESASQTDSTTIREK
ncbi:MAG: hypothetical protein V1792_22905 [Pseudomonadota bacterium]